MITHNYRRKVVDSYEDTLTLNLNIPYIQHALVFKEVHPDESDDFGSTHIEWYGNIEFPFETDRWGDRYVSVHLEGETSYEEVQVKDITVLDDDKLGNKREFVAELLRYLNSQGATAIIDDEEFELEFLLD